MKDRIKQIMEMQQMSQKNFADYIGISQATLSSIFSERTKPTLAIVEAIAQRFPMVRLEWLVSGTGEMYKKDVDPKNENEKKNINISSNSLFPMFESQETHQAERKVVKNKVSNLDPPIIMPIRKKREVKEVRIFFDDGTYETFDIRR